MNCTQDRVPGKWGWVRMGLMSEISLAPASVIMFSLWWVVWRNANQDIFNFKKVIYLKASVREVRLLFWSIDAAISLLLRRWLSFGYCVDRKYKFWTDVLYPQIFFRYILLEIKLEIGEFFKELNRWCDVLNAKVAFGVWTWTKTKCESISEPIK